MSWRLNITVKYLPEQLGDPLWVAADGVEEAGEAEAEDGAHKEEQEDQLVRQLNMEAC